MEGCLRQDGFAGQKGLRNAFGDVHRPRMKTVGAIAKGHDQAGIGNSLHERANPSREERLVGPLIFPAWRRNGLSPDSDLARSSWWRTIRLTGKPVSRRLSWSHSASSAVRRIVIV